MTRSKIASSPGLEISTTKSTSKTPGCPTTGLGMPPSFSTSNAGPPFSPTRSSAVTRAVSSLVTVLPAGSVPSTVAVFSIGSKPISPEATSYSIVTSTVVAEFAGNVAALAKTTAEPFASGVAVKVQAPGTLVLSSARPVTVAVVPAAVQPLNKSSSNSTLLMTSASEATFKVKTERKEP